MMWTFLFLCWSYKKVHSPFLWYNTFIPFLQCSCQSQFKHIIFPFYIHLLTWKLLHSKVFSFNSHVTFHGLFPIKLCYSCVIYVFTIIIFKTFFFSCIDLKLSQNMIIYMVCPCVCWTSSKTSAQSFPLITFSISFCKNYYYTIASKSSYL